VLAVPLIISFLAYTAALDCAIRYATVRALMKLFPIVNVAAFPYTGGTCNEGRRLGGPGLALTSTGWEAFWSQHDHEMSGPA
jgi:hypothetical protein